MNVYRGSTGITVSAWEIQRADTGELFDRYFIPSRGANRREWEATIMGIAGVCERLPLNSAVLIRVRQEELAEAYACGFRKTSGKPMAGQEFWSKLLAVIADKALRVTVEFAVEDNTFCTLREDAKKEGIKQFEKLGESSVRASVEIAKPKRPIRPSFDPAEGGEIDEPALILRRPKPDRRKV
ncbi:MULTISPECIES: hypothetical protein [unclassified Mesorhizobium]|uniref:hypothetical protein n=1 Tax=unclassified Mesorhizobium TaxID=325217 RepID=UPI000FCC53D0|nr:MULTISPECIES: hypothetical protein [unclassified Mesorhizobium]RUW77701.1 hypothetical protein EOA31_03690 [Mesorhizobium sp. M4B.F.Ca.ET.049.02.1.2]